MDPAQRGQLAFILTLVGGIAGIAMGLLFGAMGLLMGAFFDAAAKSTTPSQGPFPPLGLFYGLFGFFAFVAIASGIVMLVCAPRLREPLERSRSYAIAAIVAGGVCFVSGNVIAAGLGIAGGIVALTAPAPQQGASSG